MPKSPSKFCRLRSPKLFGFFVISYRPAKRDSTDWKRQIRGLRRTPLVTCVDSGEELVLSVGEKPVLKYQHAVKEAPEGIEPVYRRSGYIHPVFTPSGRVITDDFPPDEPHQHGIFFAWVNTTVAGHNVNFWDPKARHGTSRTFGN